MLEYENLPVKTFSVNNVDYELKVKKSQLNEVQRLYSCQVWQDNFNSVVLRLISFIEFNRNIDEKKFLTDLVKKCSDAIGKNGLRDLKNKFSEPIRIELCGYMFDVECPC